MSIWGCGMSNLATTKLTRHWNLFKNPITSTFQTCEFLLILCKMWLVFNYLCLLINNLQLVPNWQVDVLNVLVDCTCWPPIFNLWSQHVWAHLFHATCNVKFTLRGLVSMSSTIKIKIGGIAKQL